MISGSSVVHRLATAISRASSVSKCLFARGSSISGHGCSEGWSSGLERLALQVIRTELIRDHGRPPRSSQSGFCRHVLGSIVSSNRSALLVSQAAARTTPACRRSSSAVANRSICCGARRRAGVCFVWRCMDLSPILVARESWCTQKRDIR